MGKSVNRKLFIRNYSLPSILFFSVALRILAAFYLGNEIIELPGTFDQISYHRLALRVLSGNGFSFGVDWWPLTGANEPTAHWSYLYTFYLVLVYKLFGNSVLMARLIQAVLVGFFHPYLVFLIGRIVFNRRVGLLAAALTSGYAYFIYYSATLVTEPFYITGILAVLYLTIRLGNHSQTSIERQARMKMFCHYCVLGITLGVTILLRQLFLLIIPILFLYLLWRERKQALLGILVATGMIILIILPFSIYNHDRFDQFVLLNTNAGFAFFWANHPIYGTRFLSILPPELGSYQDLIPLDLRNLDEAALDRELLHRGFEFVTDDPIRYIRLSISRIPAYFKFWPSPESDLISNLSRIASFALLLPWMIYGLILSWQRTVQNYIASKSSSFLLQLYALLYTAIHLMSWSLIRYRLPVDAILILFAAFGILHIVSRRRRHSEALTVHA